MNETLSKYKGITYLAALLIILPTAIYLFALNKTLNVYTEYHKVLDEIENLETSMINVTEKTPELPAVSKDYISNGLIVNYLKTVDKTTENNIVIDKFIPSKIDLGNGLFVHTAQITVYSDYISIVKALNNLEKENLCNIISVHFQAEKNRQTDKVKLKANIIIQQIMEQ
ncbi:MAG: hypothetical protein LBP85_00905 [Prevotellaceae bacterium]|jgi:hypothetical protein|nr:hypothetical protein [Prevotellaceae bacterium]